ncbi:MAG TPA: FAD-linked oxidase C-terminal domain-containing protein [Spirochaetota bacterium]|nr:FAD-linked oxidase C-terminal domain-containing protein [Spirochaetota bacterium]
MYTKPTENDISFFKETLGDDQVITSTDDIKPYTIDKTKNLVGTASVVLKPCSTEEISKLLGYCSQKSLAIFTRGGGTGVTGGAVPLSDGVVLSLERMNRILEFDAKNMTLLVEPCVITGNIHGFAQEKGLLYPPDPASSDECAIGGNIAENAGGPRAVKYGVTGNYVLGLEYVLPDGTIASSGGKYVKNAAGYDMVRLLTGSEGTLAVITKALLKLVPAPPFAQDVLLSFNTLDEAVDTVTRLLAASPLPAAIEFMENDAIKLVSESSSIKIPFATAGAHLLIKLEADSAQLLKKQIDNLYKIPGISDSNLKTAKTDKESEYLWSARRGIRDAISRVSPVFFAEDCVVPRAAIALFIKSIKNELSSYGIDSLLFGHAGDGNIHIDILKGKTEDNRWEELKDELRLMIYRKSLAFKGTITGEHGIGFIRKQYLEEAIGSGAYNMMKKIKEAFDPKGILNPGKIFQD